MLITIEINRKLCCWVIGIYIKFGWIWSSNHAQAIVYISETCKRKVRHTKCIEILYIRIKEQCYRNVKCYEHASTLYYTQNRTEPKFRSYDHSKIRRHPYPLIFKWSFQRRCIRITFTQQNDKLEPKNASNIQRNIFLFQVNKDRVLFCNLWVFRRPWCDSFGQMETKEIVIKLRLFQWLTIEKLTVHVSLPVHYALHTA